MSDVDFYINKIKELTQRNIILKDHKNTNNCIGALNDVDFNVFTQNFYERIVRLYKYFNSDQDALKKLDNLLIEIGSKKEYKWSGSYSELVALDYWTQKDVYNLSIVYKENINKAPKSIAKVNGKKYVDFDLVFELPLATIYMDVKSFIPTHYELIDIIIDKVERLVGHKNFIIGIETINGGNYLANKLDLEQGIKSKELLTQLADAVNNKKSYYLYKINNRTYKFVISHPKNGMIMNTTVNEIDPYLMAENNCYKILEYYEKLLITKPSLLCFVSNPWFNKEYNGLKGFETYYYRSLARRVFIQLKNDRRKLANVISGVNDETLTVSKISKLITGIVFIADGSILEKNNIYKSWIFLNPNAKNRCLSQHDFSLIDMKNVILIDDFTHDNY